MLFGAKMSFLATGFENNCLRNKKIRDKYNNGPFKRHKLMNHFQQSQKRQHDNIFDAESKSRPHWQQT